jgi:uncharacterized membrane protein
MNAALRAIVTILCGVGLYTALFMLAKTRKAERGELDAPSVVTTARARLYGGVSNAFVGSIYYPALAIAVWVLRTPQLLAGVTLVAAFAAATSAALAYSLLFITRRPCPYCWTAHGVNWSLFGLCVWITVTSFRN